MQQNNEQKQQETVLPSFHSLISTLNDESNSNTSPINTNTWNRTQPSTSSATSMNPSSLSQFQSAYPSVIEHSTNLTECNNNNINTKPSIACTLASSFPNQFNFSSPQSPPFPQQYGQIPLYNSSQQISNQTQQVHVSQPILSASSLLLSPNSPQHQQRLSPTSLLISNTISNPLQHHIQQQQYDEQCNNSFIPPIQNQTFQHVPPQQEDNLNRKIEKSQKTKQKKEKKKQIKFMPSNNNFKSLNYSVSPPKSTQEMVSPCQQLRSSASDDMEVTNVKFSMERQSQPKRKRKGNTKNSKLSSPIVNQSEGTNDSDYSSTGSNPIQSNTNCPSSSTDNSSQNPSKSTDSNNNIMNSGLFMEFIGTSTKKRKQYRDIINYKDEFFTDSYTAEKRLRESNTKYRSKQPLNPNNKEK